MFIARRTTARLVALACASSGIALATTHSSATEPLPSCDSGTNNIHKSTKGASTGRVKVLAYTTCTMPMEDIGVQTILYKEVNGVLVYQATSPDPTKEGAAHIQRSAVGEVCVPGIYEAQSIHIARLGTFRYANTTADRRSVKCN